MAKQTINNGETGLLCRTKINENFTENYNNFTTIQTNSANYILDGGNTKNANLLIGTSDNFNLALETNNVQRLTIVSGGNIGIGTQIPAEKLTVAGTISATGSIKSNLDSIINTVSLGLGGGQNVTNMGVGFNALLSNTTGSGNIAVGYVALQQNTIGAINLAIGGNSLSRNIQGNSNVAIGNNSLADNVSGSDNTALGKSALEKNTASANTSCGASALKENTSGTNNVAVGYQTLMSNTLGNRNAGIGANSLYSNTTGNNNTAIGNNSLFSSTLGSDNTAIGAFSLSLITTASSNTAIGANTLSNATAGNLTAVGSGALRYNTTGSNNCAFGGGALFLNSTGDNNTSIGFQTLDNNTTGFRNTAIGAIALENFTDLSNCSGLGFNAQVTASNQVQLGDASTTTYAYGAVQNRSDMRDKSDVRDTELGLDFINELRPVDFKWDMREDYRTKAPSKVIEPQKIKEDASEEEKTKYVQDLVAYEAYVVIKDKWLEDSKLKNITHDGTHKRTRFHHGLIAQEIKAVIEKTGVDFGGFQDHSIDGGDEAMTIGYNELIGPMIKAIQELSQKLDNALTRIEVLENK